MEDKQALGEVFDYEFSYGNNAPAFKITTNVKSKYFFDVDAKERYLVIENALFDEKVLEDTFGDMFYDKRFKLKCRTMVRNAETNIDNEMVINLHSVVLESYELEVGIEDKSVSPNRSRVKMVFKILGDSGNVELKDKEVK